VLLMAEDRPANYDEKARNLRSLAETMTFVESREQLLNLARLFERMSFRLRAREQERQAAD